MENNKYFKELFKGAKNWLIVTDNGVQIKGYTRKLLSLYTMLTKHLNEEIDKETLEFNFKRAFYTTNELMEELDEIIEKALKELKEND